MGERITHEQARTLVGLMGHDPECTPDNAGDQLLAYIDQCEQVETERDQVRAAADERKAMVLRKCAEVTDLTRERDRLAAIVEKLPKTADGVPVLWGDQVWVYPSWGGKVFRATLLGHKPAADHRASWRFEQAGQARNLYDFECFSTREAAEAAKGVSDE